MGVDLKDFERGADYPGDYDADLAALQERLARIQVAHIVHKRRAIVAVEGWDAAGKGGIIQRLTAKWDPRYFEVWPIAAPTDEEKDRHFLWRFWERLPRSGNIAVFDRSWYGRVLVERVEQLAAPADWQRAYEEINEFERQLCDSGVLVIKFWLQIGKAEQLKRFRAREETAFKRFKITPDDWRNRKKWAAYQQAAGEMIARTGAVPWALIEAEDKYYARIKVLRTLNETIETALD